MGLGTVYFACNLQDVSCIRHLIYDIPISLVVAVFIVLLIVVIELYYFLALPYTFHFIYCFCEF